MDGLSNPSADGRLPRRMRNFLFDDDFSQAAAPSAPEPEVIAPGPVDAAVTAARAEAWGEGYAAGKAEAEAAGARALGDAGAAFSATLREATIAAAGHAEANAEALARLLMEMFATVFPDLCRRHGPAEALALVRTLLPGLAYEPTVQIAAAAELVPALEHELARTLTTDDRARVRVSGEPRMAPGDVRVSWRRGAAQRDTRALWDEVQAILASTGMGAAERQLEKLNAD